MSCDAITNDRLAVYFAGDLAPADATALEEHVFACDACGASYSAMGMVVARVRYGASRGALLFALSADILANLRASGVRVIERSAAKGGGLHVPATDEIDLMVGHLEADLRDVRRIDVEFVMESGGIDLEEDVPVDSQDGLIICCTRHLVNAAGGTQRSLCRVYASDDPTRRVIAEYQLSFTVGA